jgi:hypothetical protein
VDTSNVVCGPHNVEEKERERQREVPCEFTLQANICQGLASLT